ncbi:MAG: hypothetical protein ACJAUV_002328 [Flavobacteriales bacterium]|jgi:hypothetical protein
MSSFQLYVKLGWDHLSDLNGYDHMLFLLVLVVGIQLKQWKQIGGLVTAFTIGHTLALFSVVLFSFPVPVDLVEQGILWSIVALAIQKLVLSFRQKETNVRWNPQYALVLFFGLIHGLGFSSYLKAMILPEKIVVSLLGFNLGLELAQIAFVCLILSVFILLYKFFNTNIITRIVTTVVSAWVLFLLTQNT